MAVSIYHLFESCAVYDGTQTQARGKTEYSLFESYAVYVGSQTHECAGRTARLFESCAVYVGGSLIAPPNAYCWLDYHALYKTPLILSHSLSANCSGIPMFDVWGGLREYSNKKAM